MESLVLRSGIASRIVPTRSRFHSVSARSCDGCPAFPKRSLFLPSAVLRACYSKLPVFLIRLTVDLNSSAVSLCVQTSRRMERILLPRAPSRAFFAHNNAPYVVIILH